MSPVAFLLLKLTPSISEGIAIILKSEIKGLLS